MNQYVTLMHPRTLDSQPFWEGCNRNEFMLQRCKDCEACIYYPRMACPRCGSTQLGWTSAKGIGKVHSFTHVFVPFYGDTWKSQIPYTPIIVDLIEEVRVVSRLIGADREKVQIGSAVKLVFVEVDSQKLPFFELTLA